ncbi:phosphoethanolamine--lipid A transferase [Comamonas sp.]|uniref:phosphoethanolamine transferase n=1 Tax=Comamonas sp. TaxID=34028 RepID=UPI00289EE7F0|nr:phosphoethanolamine--lipid A transferase [Comamonas sp.]
MFELHPTSPLPSDAPYAARSPQHFTPYPISARWMALILALWCTLALNQAWWHKLSELSSEQSLSGWEMTWTALVLTSASYVWLMLLSWPKLRRMGWSLTLITAAAVQYFMLHYGIVMDSSMVRNTLQTNTSESLALVTSGLLGHVLMYAGLPIAILYAGIRLKPTQWRHDAWRSALMVSTAFAVMLGGGLLLYKPMAPLVRNHTEIRYLINPLASIVSFGSVTLKPLFKRELTFRRISDDAALGSSYQGGHLLPMSTQNQAYKPPLLVLIVGETTRADHFGLNGYPRNTTPEMEARHVINWRNVQSCGTNTLASVPCMFSHLGKKAFESRKFEYENLLDVLHAAGLNVDWLDNQAGCKGVCNRISHAQADQVASKEAIHRWCKDSECLDQLMVELLDDHLHSVTRSGSPQGTVLVLHQMGSHGPAYYRRSSAPSKHFQPECTTHVTSDCSRSQLVNVYDNSMVETDLFVARTIDWLQTQQDKYDTGLIYLSDHGESLGENGLYLHGLPYVIAPDAQKHVPWVMWPGTLLARTQVNEACVRQNTDQALSHDNFYHTVMGLLDVQSSSYNSTLDVLQSCRTPNVKLQAQQNWSQGSRHPSSTS